jgi:putative redox protein
MDKEIHYTKGDITVVWKPDLCQGSTRCWRELPEVFHHGQRPWVTPEGASDERIIAQVERCPSGALSIIHKEK